MSIHQETTFPTSPERVYELLTHGAEFAAATGRAASIGTAEGAEFSLFDGFISGRLIELVPGRRVVQAWRGQEWEPGVYSLVRFTVEADEEGARLILDHSGYPEGESPRYPTWHEHLSTNWPVFYFEPFRKYLGTQFVSESAAAA
jgi:activator of HSP90 ATPase